MRVVRRLLVAVGAIAVACAGGCTDDPAPPGARVSPPVVPAASAPAWREPAAYGYVLERRCAGGPSLGRYRVTVADGVVTGVERLAGAGGTGGAPASDIDVPTLTELVDLAVEARDDGGAATVEVDPADGRPVRVAFSRTGAATEGDSCFEVSDYRPGPAAPAAPPDASAGPPGP